MATVLYSTGLLYCTVLYRKQQGLEKKHKAAALALHSTLPFP